MVLEGQLTLWDLPEALGHRGGVDGSSCGLKGQAGCLRKNQLVSLVVWAEGSGCLPKS